jgi:hypothetical protein
MKRYPIHQTAPGPNYMKPVQGRWTHNPIKEGNVFKVTYQGMKIKFRIDMNFHTDPDFTIVEIIEVKGNE